MGSVGYRSDHVYLCIDVGSFLVSASLFYCAQKWRIAGFHTMDIVFSAIFVVKSP